MKMNDPVDAETIEFKLNGDTISAFAITRAAKVVIVSGLSGPMDRVRGSLAGCDAYLTKPVDDAEFQRTVLSLDPALSRRVAKSRPM